MIAIDTTPLVALCDPRDAKHRVAVKDLESLVGDEFAVCEAVLTEACFHLPYRNQRRRLRALLDFLKVQAPPAVSTDAFWSDAFEWLVKYADHEPDWADACLAVLSEREKHVKVWTYDREFRTTWRRLNGTAIPLAVKLP
jgi:predicted nucleic acid-binding protein